MAHAPKVYPAPTQTALMDGWIVQAQYWAVCAGASTSSGPNTAVRGTRGRNPHLGSGERRSSRAMPAFCPLRPLTGDEDMGRQAARPAGVSDVRAVLRQVVDQARVGTRTGDRGTRSAGAAPVGERVRSATSSTPRRRGRGLSGTA